MDIKVTGFEKAEVIVVSGRVDSIEAPGSGPLRLPSATASGTGAVT